ncbi:Prospero domain-containing protein [Aphelenchoides besseyi]|nr:Prospero domain-containing protein [Aphelenchoides besseyi]
MSSGGTVPPSPVIPFSTSQFQANNQSLSKFFDSNPFSIDCINGNSKSTEEKQCNRQAEVEKQSDEYQEDEFDSFDEIMAAEEQQRDSAHPADSPMIEDENSKTKSTVDNVNTSNIEAAENRHSNNSAMSVGSSSRRKRFHPQRQPVKIDHTPSETGDEPPLIIDSRYDCDDPESKKEKNDEDDGTYDLEENNSSRDLSPFPGLARAGSPPVSTFTDSTTLTNQISGATNGPHPLNSNPNKFREMFEFQQRMYAAVSQQQQLQQQQRATNNSQSTETEEAQALTAAVKQIFRQFTQSLTEEFVNSLKRLETESYAPEIERMSAQHVHQAQQIRQQKDQKMQQEWRQQQARMTAAVFGMPPNLTSSNSLFNSLNLPPYATNPNNLMALTAASNQQNPLSSLASSLATSNAASMITKSNSKNENPSDSTSRLATSSGSGIFPTTLPNFPSFNGFVNHSLIGSSIRSEDGSPRKKRSKVTDSVRGPRASAVRDTGNSLPTSNRSSPQPNSYFPPTMVAHPMFKMDASARSPGNSDGSDCDADSSYMNRYSSVRAPVSNLHSRISGNSFSSTLTHVHLRKAKLMFFYTRYPNSSVLKSYFPDISFNKHNTAQLVKWFSNFREFYYMQMEKYAKQALAEGIQDENEISVTTDSEIYRTLNQHYNRNNFITPPESLPNVIEETLKEFFRALRDGRDAEPSWKKAIYKIINQLDEQIPECFKSPLFMTQLEGNQQ